jgi:hypothetical protein
VRLALNVTMQNDRFFLDVILLQRGGSVNITTTRHLVPRLLTRFTVHSFHSLIAWGYIKQRYCLSFKQCQIYIGGALRMLTLFWHLRNGIQISKSIPVAAVYGVGLWPLSHRVSRFESRRKHGCLSVAECRVIRVEISASGRSLFQSSLTECGVIECDQMQQLPFKPTMGR